MSINLKLTRSFEELPLGSSHILGCPDVPSNWNDEAIFFNDEVFVGQINLKDFKEIDSLLPKEGMLYFFIQSMSKPIRGIVRYTNNLDNLDRIDFNIDSPVQAFFEQEYLIKETNEDSKITLLATKEKKDLVKDDEVILFKFNPVDYPRIDFLKGLSDCLVYVIKKDDLSKQAFNNCHLNITIEKC